MWRNVLLAALAVSGCKGDGSDGSTSDSAAVDTDGDDSPAGIDCDDADPLAHPDAIEVCDGIDNDCNGLVDDAPSNGVEGFIDLDGDGFGDEAFAGCTDPEVSVVAVGGDCDDDANAVHPDALEVCNGIDDNCDGNADEGVPNDGAGCVDPGPPVPPAAVDVITITIRTDDGPDDGSDSNSLSLCLTDARCFVLDAVDVNDARVGELDVHHFEDIGVPAADFDQVRLLSVGGTDSWKPACVQVEFDGVPVYCEDEIGVTMGLGPGEVTEWTDPAGFHQGCTSCYPALLTHGPTVGAVGPDTARLWMRADASRRVEVRVAKGSGTNLDTVAPASILYPRAREDYATTADIQGLEPATNYTYAFEVDGTLGPAHEFRTAPAAGEPTQLRFAFGSCARQEDQSAFAAMGSFDPSLFLFVGDAHYANSGDLNSERWFYRWSLERPPRAAMLAETPTIAVWDDHDYTGDNTDGFEPGKTTALRTFDEYWANPGLDGFGGDGVTPGVFFNYRWADIEFFMLDVRYHRSLDGSMLGAEQMAWLEQALSDSTATFKFIAGGSQFTSESNSDSWAAFPESQAALFDYITAEGIDGVVLLSGDIHRAEFRTISRSAAGGYDLPELTSSPLSNTNSPCSPDPEQRDCVDDDKFFVIVDVDTTLADPAFRAQIYDQFTNLRGEWTIARSSLVN